MPDFKTFNTSLQITLQKDPVVHECAFFHTSKSSFLKSWLTWQVKEGHAYCFFKITFIFIKVICMCHLKSIDNKRSVINPAIPRCILPHLSHSCSPEATPQDSLSYFPGVYYYFYIYFHITYRYCRCKMASQLSQLSLLSTHSLLTFFKMLASSFG